MSSGHLDPSVVAELPKYSPVISTEARGIRFWAQTGRINVELDDGTPISFFIKVLPKEIGKNMVHGDTLLPGFTPKPIAWGTYKNVPDIHFFLCEYREMVNDMPDPRKFAARLAELHQNSKSRNGKFGFHATTYSGNLPQKTDWEESWEVFFSKSMRQALALELQAKGPDPELDVLVPILFDKVIPRPLRLLRLREGR